MVTVDAPLFGVVMILNGQVILRGSHEEEKIGFSPGFVSYHQDSTYWGLDPSDVMTAWVAFTDANLRGYDGTMVLERRLQDIWYPESFDKFFPRSPGDAPKPVRRSK
jgi:hypothetical protein